MREKIERAFKTKVSQTFARRDLTPGGATPPEFLDDGQEQFRTHTLFVNGSIICDETFVKQCKELAPNTAQVSQNRILAMLLDPENASKQAVYPHEQLADVEYSPDIDYIPCTARMLRMPWDTIRYHNEELIADLRALTPSRRSAPPRAPGATLLKSVNIRLGSGTRIYPCSPC